MCADAVAEAISIHTTAKVVTISCQIPAVTTFDFNPHHREGGDGIHRATNGIQGNFNPHHREGGDYCEGSR